MLPTSKFDNVPPQGTDRSFKPLFYQILIIFKKFVSDLYCKLLVLVITFIIRVISASRKTVFYNFQI